MSNHSNIHIRATKAANVKVIRVEALECWQRLKIHRLSLTKYLEKEKIKLFCQEIELSTEIQLKTIPYWLINKSQLEERLLFSTKRESANVIKVDTSKKVAKLCSNRLRFGGTLKIIKKYWKVRLGSICLGCARIAYDGLRKCKDRAI